MAMIFDPSKLPMPSRNHIAFWGALTGAILGLKIVLLALDSLPLFYLGDSAVYLSSAVTPSLPGDRSFTYGVIFIRPILAVFGSIKAVVVVQSVLSAATSVLVAVCLRVGFRAPLWVAAVAALLYAVEPLALIGERLIMTETLTLFFLAWFVLTGLCYINRPRASLLIVLAFLGTCVLSLRTFHIPVVLVATMAAVLLGVPRLKALRAGGMQRFGSKVLLQVLVAVGATMGFHVLYQSYFAYMTKQPPSYNSLDGLFLVAAWAPVVTPEDFPRMAMAERVLPNLKFDLHNRFTRPNQRFSQGGLVELLLAEQGGDFLKANALAKTIALHAALRDPIGVTRLAVQTYADYWDRERIKRSILVDQGQMELDQQLIDYFKAHYSEDLSKHHLQGSISKRWHRAAIPWYRLLLLSPLFSVLLCIPRAHREAAIFIGVTACAVMVVSVAFVVESTVRFHHALAWLTCIQLGVLLCYLDTPWQESSPCSGVGTRVISNFGGDGGLIRVLSCHTSERLNGRFSQAEVFHFCNRSKSIRRCLCGYAGSGSILGRAVPPRLHPISRV